MRHPDEKIEQTEKIVAGSWQLICICFKELWEEIKNFYVTMKRNFIGQTGTRKVATFIFALIILVPAWFSWWWMVSWAYNFINNIISFDYNVQVLRSNSEMSVRDFFDKYNNKYWIDCDWIKKVNVDMNMDKLGTDKKPWKFCSLTSKVQIFPITVDNPITDGTQYARVNWKALYVVFNGTDIQNAWYQRYELWRKMEWPIEDWKFNPFPQENKERLK